MVRLCAFATSAVLIAACGAQVAPSSPAALTAPPAASSTGSTSPALPAPQAGGTLRVVIPANAYAAGLQGTDAELLDPQLWDAAFTGGQELLRCCLQRTLFSHNGRSTEEGGSRLQPDMASALPDVSPDGRTWTIHIKPALHYAPPLQGIEITSHDFVRSFERLFSPALARNASAYFSFDFGDIEGSAAFQAGEASSISGLETPDDHTLVIHLGAMVGDFGTRLAESAAGPLPPNPADATAAFGIAQGADSGFGRFLVSSGPYMVEGADQLDFSIPATRRPAPSGFVAGQITLVRSPSWDRASDSLRPAYPDRIEIRLAESLEAATGALDAGTADLVWPTPGKFVITPDVYARYQSNPARGQAHVSATGSARHLIMNLALPPFDDIHVRKALNYAIDKQHLVDLGGGSVAAQPLGHIMPDVYEDNLLADYDPYATPANGGDLAKAHAEIVLSRYDTNADGTCDAAACRNVRAVVRDSDAAIGQAVADELKPLGIDLQVEVVDNQAFLMDTGSADAKNTLLIGMGFHTVYISATAFLLLFDGRLTIDNPPGTTNFTMVGATPEQLRKWGYTVTSVPNVDDRVAACLSLIGAPQFACSAADDQYLMESVVPFVPYRVDRYVAITSPRVVSYSFDALVGTTALDQLAVKQ